MRMYAARITTSEDLKEAILSFAKNKQLSSGVIVSAVGSLSKVTIRVAGAQLDNQDMRVYEGAFEIVSLIGTISSDAEVHLHISVSDKDGQVIGGHMKGDCIVHTTVELAIASDLSLQFTREFDSATGFDELKVKEL